jgi:hypothetical protein
MPDAVVRATAFRLESPGMAARRPRYGYREPPNLVVVTR